MEFHNKIMSYFSEHICFANITHLSAGFGIAVLLQHYTKGRSFVPPLVGWLLVGFSAIAHVIAFYG